jgi:uncharacterized YkwD family protein/spore coat assembly protein SafA
MNKFLKRLVFTGIIIILLFAYINTGFAQTNIKTVHTVRYGDSLWKIAVRYEVGLSELINANPQIENPDLIYPGQQIKIPDFDDVKAKEMEVIRLVNVERAKYGLKPLAHNWELSRVARFKSKDMAQLGYFDHTSPTYGSPFKMMSDFGIRYSYAGENIAMGYRTPEEVVKGWMNSPGHRRNILSSNFTQIGVGYAVNSQGTPYWTQMFISQ